MSWILARARIVSNRAPARMFFIHAPARPVSILAVVAFLPMLAGCTADGAGARGQRAVEFEAARLSDSLLGRPELQRIVNLQVARNGEGLVPYLADESPLVRARTLVALASVQEVSATAAILPLLDDPEWSVRRDAAFALGQLDGSGGAAAALLRALVGEEEPAVRVRLMEAIGKVGDAVALQALHAAATRPDEEADLMLSFARFGIRGEHRAEVVQTLAEALSSPEPLVRERAAYYFGRVTPTDPWRPAADQVREALDGLVLSDPAAMHLLNGLGRLSDPSDRSRLTRWAEAGSDERIRTNAVRALGSQPPGVEVDGVLLAALADPSTHVGVTAATALAGRELQDASLERVRAWIAESPEADANAEGWRIAAPLLPPLVQAGRSDIVIEWMNRAASDAVSARSRALAALASAPGEGAFRAMLAEAGSSDPRVAAAAVTALAARWRSVEGPEAPLHEYFAAFQEALEGGNRASAAAVAPVLASEAFRPLGAVALLVARYRGMSAPEDVGAMTAILGALGTLGEGGDAAAIDVIREALVHPDAAIRARAAGAFEQATGESVEVEPAEATGQAIDWERLNALGRHPRLVLETGKGRVVIALATEEAPQSTQRIADVAAAGRFDGTPFHRVVPNFVVQGGDVRRGEDADDGWVPPIPPIRSEFNAIAFDRGVIGMASSGKDTETSQFYITHSMQPHLDGGYTAFGWVVEGMEVVDVLYEDDRIVRAFIENDTP